MEAHLLLFGGALVLLAFYAGRANAGIYDKESDDFITVPETAPDYQRIFEPVESSDESPEYAPDVEDVYFNEYSDEDYWGELWGSPGITDDVGEWAYNEYGDVYLVEPIYNPGGIFQPVNYTPKPGGSTPSIWGNFQMPRAQSAITYSDYAVSFIRAEEGYSATPYRDANGWSIGYGHYMGANPTIERVTQQEAEKFLLSDMNDALALVRLNSGNMALNQNQLDALVSAAYNIGPKLFRNRDGSRTGIYKALQANNPQAVAQELARWNKSAQNGVTTINPVLEARRAKEIALFMTQNV